MKFESGFEKKERDDRKSKGEILKGLDAYKDFNGESVDELLEKRQKEQMEIIQRQEEKIIRLKKMGDGGVLYVKE